MASFTGRDLALLLPDKLDVRNAEAEKDLFEPLKPKIDQSKKVTRYYPGKAPAWVGDEGIFQKCQNHLKSCHRLIVLFAANCNHRSGYQYYESSSLYSSASSYVNINIISNLTKYVVPNLSHQTCIKLPTYCVARSSNQDDDYIEVIVDRSSSKNFQAPVVEVL